MSSNRGKKYDNIYSFVETKKIKDYLASTIHGIVTDGATGEPIEGASVVVLDEDNVEVAKFLTNEKGRYQGTLEYMKSYILKATSPGYTGDDGYSEKFVKIREHNFQLDQDEHMVKKGLDLAEILNIKIYFALDRHNIRPDAEVELEKLVVVLKEYPTIKNRYKITYRQSCQRWV